MVRKLKNLLMTPVLLSVALPALGQEGMLDVLRGLEQPTPPAAKREQPPSIPVASEEAVFCSPFIADEEGLPTVGFILRPLTEKIQISTEDLVLLLLRRVEKVSVGNRYSVIRKDRLILHPRTGASLGHRVRVVGIVEVTAVEGLAVRAKVVSSCDVIVAGDELLPYQKLEFPSSLQPLPTDVKVEGAIVGSVDDQEILGMRHVVFLDLGLNARVGPGDVFTIFQRIGRVFDPTTGKLAPLLLNPVGELVVLKASRRTATAVIVQSLQEIRLGAPIALSRRVP